MSLLILSRCKHGEVQKKVLMKKDISVRKRRTILKMLAVMERGTQGAGPSSVAGSSSPSDPPIQEFLSSGRTGRRNALPDILGEHAIVTSSDLPTRMQGLTTKDQTPSTSSDAQPGPSSSKS